MRKKFHHHKQTFHPTWLVCGLVSESCAKASFEKHKSESACASFLLDASISILPNISELSVRRTKTGTVLLCVVCTKKRFRAWSRVLPNEYARHTQCTAQGKHVHEGAWPTRALHTHTQVHTVVVCRQKRDALQEHTAQIGAREEDHEDHKPFSTTLSMETSRRV